MKVYVVMSGYVDTDDVLYRQVEAVFSNKEKADAFAVTFDDEHCIEEENLYMVPEDIYNEYMDLCDNIPGLKIESYKGFAPEAFSAQRERCDLYDQNWVHSVVNEWEVL